MFKLLADEANNTSPLYTYILIGIMIVLLIAFYVMGHFRKNKQVAQRTELENLFTVGTKIITSFGVYGEIVEIRETTDGKVALISTGEGKSKTYMTVHMNAIMNIDRKQDVVYDKDGNDITPYDEIEKSYDVDAPVEQPVEEEKVEDVKEEKAEEKTSKSQPKEKTSTKKTTKKQETK